LTFLPETVYLHPHPVTAMHNGVLSIRRISVRRIPIIGLGLGLGIGLGIGLGMGFVGLGLGSGLGFGELKFGELKRNPYNMTKKVAAECTESCFVAHYYACKFGVNR